MNHYVPILQEYVCNTRFEFDQLIDHAGILVIRLNNNNSQLELKFSSYVAYRKLDEGDALLTLSAMRNSGKTNKCLYRVDNSNFLTWFNTERCGSMSNQCVTHYSIAPANDIIDVLSLDFPEVRLR